MNRNEIISCGLLELYATGVASEVEAKQVQQYATQYPEVADELAQIEACIEAYSFANAIQPDPSVKEKIFATIRQYESAGKVSIDANEAKPAKVIAISSSWEKLAAAAVLLLIGSVAVNVSLYNKNKVVASQLLTTQQTLAGLQEKDSNMTAELEVVQNKFSLPVSLNGLEVAPDAAAKIFWMKNTGEVYIDASNLPEVPLNKQYQLWGFVDGKPVSGGMIITTKKGSNYRIQKMKTFGRAEAFAVSLEDKKDIPGEVPQGPVYVMGKM